MLGQQKGITTSKSTYPQGTVKVGFDPEQTTEKAIVAFIADLGFTVEGKDKGEAKGDISPAGGPPQSKRQPRA